MAKKVNKNEEQFPQVEETLSKTQQYIEKNQKRITIAISILIALFAVYPIYQNFILGPMEEDAKNDMYMAEIYFQKDSFLLALVGDGQYFGFLDIIEEYGITRSANMSNYYAGLCYWHMSENDFQERIIPIYSSTLQEASVHDNKYRNTIEYLSEFSSKEEIISSLAIGGIGDAYMELEEVDKALEYYEEAADNSDNELTSPRFLMKQAMIHELNQNYNQAVTVYKKIKKEYTASREAQNIDKYISRAENR